MASLPGPSETLESLLSVRNPMLIDLKKIPEGGLRVQRTLTIGEEEAHLDLQRVGPIEIDVRVLEDDHGAVIVTGSYSTRVTLRCARCLRSFPEDIEERFTSIFEVRPQNFPEEAQVSEGELDMSYLEEDQESLDMRDVLREQVLLQLPMKPLHDLDCEGLCPLCGVDRNEETCSCREADFDPRFAELEKIKARMENPDSSDEDGS